MMFLKALLVLGALAGVTKAEELNLQNRIVFSEIYFRPSGGDREAFIELYNPTNTVINAGLWKVCDASGACTQLAGSLGVDSYLTLCKDMSAYIACNQATSLQLDTITQLFVKDSNDQTVDVVTVTGTPPTGSAYTRGLDQNNLLTFAFTTDVNPGSGWLGGPEPTIAPTPAPFSVAGVDALFLNEVSISGDRFVEFAFKSSKSLSNYLLTIYDDGGSVISERQIGGATLGPTASGGLSFAYLPLTQTTSDKPFGIALTGSGYVWSFVSLGGTITAIAGAASGATSTNLGGADIYQLRGNGCDQESFNWAASSSRTKGSVNTNQFPTCDSVIFFNEIVFNQASNNYLEVGFTSGLSSSDLSKCTCDLYSRLTKSTFASFKLDQFTVGSSSNGITFAYVSLDEMRRRRLFRALQSLTPEGFAISCTNTGLIEFYSILGGVFTASNGVAAGTQSSNFDVNQAGGRIFGGNTGIGCGPGDFAFGADGSTRGALNTGQTISCTASAEPGDGVLEPPPTPVPTPAPTQKPTPVPTPIPTVNTNECQTGQDNCHPLADCIDLPNGFTCMCKTGYTGDGVTSCIDIDECVVDKPCAPSEQGGFCVDNDGTFTCGCRTGWTGNGFTCSDINECTQGPGCGPKTSCSNTVGSYVCTCLAGYAGNPYNVNTGCTDINECLSNPCGPNGACTNRDGTYICSCNPGYALSGGTCVNINECSSNPCSPNASCVDTVGGFTCTCNNGFTGNGFTCTPSSPQPTPKPSTSPPTPPPTRLTSEQPSPMPTITDSPSRSLSPSITSQPSAVPSLSNEPSRTQPPSTVPSISELPSITSNPSAAPSQSNAPTN